MDDKEKLIVSQVIQAIKEQTLSDELLTSRITAQNEKIERVVAHAVDQQELIDDHETRLEALEKSFWGKTDPGVGERLRNLERFQAEVDVERLKADRRDFKLFKFISSTAAITATIVVVKLILNTLGIVIL